MEKLQKIQTDELSGRLVLLLEKSKKSFAVEDVLSIQMLPSPWYALHKVSYTQKTNFILNLVLLTFIVSIVTAMIGPLNQVLPALLFYCFIFFGGLVLLIASPKKSNSVEILIKNQSIKIKDLTNKKKQKSYF